MSKGGKNLQWPQNSEHSLDQLGDIKETEDGAGRNSNSFRVDMRSGTLQRKLKWVPGHEQKNRMNSRCLES